MHLTNEELELIRSALMYTITHGYTEDDDPELISMRILQSAIVSKLNN